MGEQQIRKIWLAVALGVLVATYPSWLSPKSPAQANYDAPWVYPGLSPAVQH